MKDLLGLTAWECRHYHAEDLQIGRSAKSTRLVHNNEPPPAQGGLETSHQQARPPDAIASPTTSTLMGVGRVFQTTDTVQSQTEILPDDSNTTRMGAGQASRKRRIDDRIAEQVNHEDEELMKERRLAG
jgi:hypothetical protein